MYNIADPFSQLAAFFKNLDYQLIPYGWVIIICKALVQQSDRRFYGVRLSHVGVENLIECPNKLLMHYECLASLGLKLQASMDCFVIELGMLLQPLIVRYKQYLTWVTSSWLRFLWEKIDMF